MVWEDWLAFAITAVVAMAVATAITLAAAGIVRVVARKRSWPRELIHRVRHPFRALVLLLALWLAVDASYPDPDSAPFLSRIFGILAIVATAWLLISLVLFATDVMLGRFRVDVPDNRAARKIRTQTLILRRLSIAIIVIIGVASILLTFPAVQTIGASLLASAGIASIVAGLAAQSVLGNMFAGVQLVFSDALRVDDVLVVNGEWGRVGEITLSYVVLDAWDQRRVILPCTYFTTQPFENWTRRGSELLGAVELDVDWRVPVDRVRDRLREVLDGTELWDGRTSVVQVTDSTGGLVRLRVLVSAADSGSLWDLRCVVREQLVTFIQQVVPASLPLQRVLVDHGVDGGTAGVHSGDSVADPSASRDDAPSAPPEGLFSGSDEATERHELFTKAIPLPPQEDDTEWQDDIDADDRGSDDEAGTTASR